MDKTESRQLTEEIVKILDGRKAKSIEVIHPEKLGALTDSFIICSGTSSTHLRGIADEVLEKLKEKGLQCAHLEGYDTANWILLDYIDVVIHIFQEADREYYNIERLWKDGK